MNLTIEEVNQITERAEQHVYNLRKARFEDLDPVFDKFIDQNLSMTKCFEFLLKEGAVTKEDKWSVRKHFYIRKSSRNKEESEK